VPDCAAKSKLKAMLVSMFKSEAPTAKVIEPAALVTVSPPTGLNWLLPFAAHLKSESGPEVPWAAAMYSIPEKGAAEQPVDGALSRSMKIWK
jgi:hypothetical protein